MCNCMHSKGTVKYCSATEMPWPNIYIYIFAISLALIVSVVKAMHVLPHWPDIHRCVLSVPLMGHVGANGRWQYYGSSCPILNKWLRWWWRDGGAHSRWWHAIRGFLNSLSLKQTSAGSHPVTGLLGSDVMVVVNKRPMRHLGAKASPV